MKSTTARLRSVLVVLVCLSFALAACAQVGTVEPTKVLAQATRPAENAATPVVLDLLGARALAIRALADRLGVDVRTITVAEGDAVDLAAGAPGCPEARAAAAAPEAAAQPAFRFLLAAGDLGYIYYVIGGEPVYCGEQGGGSAAGGPTATPAGRAAEGAIMSSLDQEGRQAVADARQDLAARLGVSADVIVLTAGEPVRWPDASLGCPEPGKFYAQVVTPGYRIVLAQGGTSYEYHAGKGHVVFCGPAAGGGSVPFTPQEQAIVDRLDQEGQQVVLEARQELADKLNTAPQELTLLRAEAVKWPSAALGCPQPGMSYADVIVEGYQVVFGHAGQEYDYHAGQGRLVLCEQK